MLGDIVLYVNGEVKSAAIIVKVNADSTVNLQVFNDAHSITYVDNATLSAKRVEGQYIATKA